MIQIEHVSFSYEANAVLNDVSIAVGRGEFVALVGPNGGGKTTLIRLLAGLCQASAGHIHIDGQEPRTFLQTGTLAYVPQQYSHNVSGFPMTVKELLHLLPQRRRTAKEVLQIVGLEGVEGNRLEALSGGQLQRVLIARALLTAPKVLLLDEPTSGVDYEASTQIYQLLQTLCQQEGMTVVMVSHDIDNAARWTSRVACINKGLCFYGTNEEFASTHIQERHLWYFTG
jgi:zinc transport system ATP-binding protein